MLKELALKWFHKNQYNTALLHKIAKIINPLLYLLIPYSLIIKLFSKKHKPHKLKHDFFAKTASIYNKSQLYSELITKTQDEFGFIETEHCDSTLFSGLVSSTKLGKPVYLKAAAQKGKWYRRPLIYPPCYQPGDKGSSVSRDMLLGVLWHSWTHKDISILLQLENYGNKNNWVMGEGDISRIYFTPSLRATLDKALRASYDGPGSIDHLLPHFWSTGLEDYEAHLAMLHIELLGQIDGYIDTKMKKVIIDIANRMKRNALAQTLRAKWVDGDFSDAIELLINEKIWPSDRLPTSKDRREQWITQRGDESDGWLISDEDSVKVHSGGDFLFCAKILFGAS